MPLKPAIIQREFLGWDQPALKEVACRLRERYQKTLTMDLGHVIVVVPGQRAGRRLQELLACLAEDEKLRFTPPHIVTEGRLPEMLYLPKQPFANDLTQELAWAKALQAIPKTTLRHLVPHPPETTDPLGWLRLGKMIRRLHVDLAGDGLDFTAVIKKSTRLSESMESDRWNALATVQEHYLQLLDQLKLWDMQTARLKAIELCEIHTNWDIILLGTVDLNNTLRQMLNQIASRVTAYIIAPEELSKCFDNYGCLVPEEWDHAIIPIEDKQLRQSDGPAQQADEVTTWLARLDGRFRRDEITIGVPDESLVPQLQRQLEQVGIRSRWVEGVRLGDTGPYRLLNTAVQYAAAHHYEYFAELVRHPDMEDWLAAKQAIQTSIPANPPSSLPAQLDQFYNQHLPNRMDKNQALLNASEWPDLAPAIEAIDTWLECTATSHPLRAWSDQFCKILGTIYVTRMLQLDVLADEVLHRTLRRILEVCNQLASIPEALDNVSLSAADAFQVALGTLADENLPPPADPDAIEILGWLELSLDDAPALCVTSFNEGFVPKSAGTDTFLPDRLRQELGLLHNERRYTRDAYATCVLCHSRQELQVQFARRDTDNNPLQPSRLIFACNEDLLISRARRFFSGAKSEVSSRRLLLAPKGKIPDQSYFEVPRPISTGYRKQRFQVTEFKHYLACPYRYYLRRVRRLEAIDDASREMDGGAFGTLLHNVLGAFGQNRHGLRDSDNEHNIFHFLAEQLSKFAEQIYGSDQRRPGIRLQLEQARQRLRAFATEQVEQRRAGWRIVYAESDDPDPLSTSFLVDDEPMTLVGRIDRIDLHELDKTVRILDYKTADNAKSPDETHLSGGAWSDLQLPLYRHLLSSALSVPADFKVEVAYFNLPKTESKTKVAVAKWDNAQFVQADDEARRIIRGIRQEEFWPPSYPAPQYSEDLAAICLDNVLSGPALADDENGGAS